MLSKRLCLLGLATLSTVLSQGMNMQPSLNLKFHLDNSATSLVTLVEFDRAAVQAQTGKVLEPSAIMLINNTERAIVALRGIWITPNPNGGRPLREELTTDIYQTPNLKPIMLPKSTTVIGPGTVMAKDGRGFSGTVPPQLVQKYAAAGEISVSIDAVVFEDGELAGPDTLGLGADLTARKRAATQIETKLKNAGDSKQQALLEIRDARPQSASSYDVKLLNCLRQLAESGLRMMELNKGNSRPFEQFLASLPEPVHTFRK